MCHLKKVLSKENKLWLLNPLSICSLYGAKNASIPLENNVGKIAIIPVRQDI